MCTFYERTTELCKNMGVTGSRMCLDLGLSKSTLSDLKSGRKKSVTAETAQKIASYLGVSVAYLLGEEDIKKEQPTTNGELSNKRAALIQFAHSVPEDKVDMILQVMKTILANG